MIFKPGIYTASYIYLDPSTLEAAALDSVKTTTVDYSLNSILEQFVALEPNIKSKDDITNIKSGSLNVIVAYRNLGSPSNISGMSSPNSPSVNTSQNNAQYTYPSLVKSVDTHVSKDIDIRNNSLISTINTKTIQDIKFSYSGVTPVTTLKEFGIQVKTELIDTTRIIYIEIPVNNSGGTGGGTVDPPVLQPTKYKFKFIVTDESGNTFMGTYIGINNSGVPSGADIISTEQL